jgi:hypothetical protein
MPLRKNYVSANIVKRVIYMSTVNTKLTQDLMVVEFISLLSAKSLKKKIFTSTSYTSHRKIMRKFFHAYEYRKVKTESLHALILTLKFIIPMFTIILPNIKYLKATITF